MTGIYFLLLKKKIIYVGKTENWPKRIISHKFKYDEAKLFECQRELLTDYEQKFIRLFKPANNTQHRLKARRNLLTDKWIIDNWSEILPLVEFANKNGIRLVNSAMKSIGNKAKEELGYSQMTSAKDIWTTIFLKSIKMSSFS